jgi:hypothetical protein
MVIPVTKIANKQFDDAIHLTTLSLSLSGFSFSGIRKLENLFWFYSTIPKYKMVGLF